MQFLHPSLLHFNHLISFLVCWKETPKFQFEILHHISWSDSAQIPFSIYTIIENSVIDRIFTRFPIFFCYIFAMRWCSTAHALYSAYFLHKQSHRSFFFYGWQDLVTGFRIFRTYWKRNSSIDMVPSFCGRMTNQTVAIWKRIIFRAIFFSHEVSLTWSRKRTK